MIINTPENWCAQLPRPAVDGHKYDRGHALILAAPELTGATRLAASACSRIGAGLVTVLAAERSDIYRATLDPDILVCDGASIEANKMNVVLAGSGGVSQDHVAALAAVPSDCARVLDAGALDLLTGSETRIAETVLTPHEGEFARTFQRLEGSRTSRALQAARSVNAIIVLKGAETIIAAPDGQCVVNQHASPYLAKAGTGDVLAGMIAGLIAQHMPPFLASCAAVWMHGEAARRIGPGLVPQTINDKLASVLSDCL